MTCIAALREAGKVYFAADSLFSRGDNMAYQAQEPKIIKIGPVLIGFAGSVRQLQVIKHATNFRDMLRSETTEEYIFTLCELFRKTLAHRKALTESDGEQESFLWMLLSIKGRIFRVGSDFSFTEPTRKYQAIGSGENYALGSLKSTTGDPKKRVIEAVKTAAHFDPGVGGRIITLEG